MGETGLFSNFMFFFRPLLSEASLPTRKGALQLVKWLRIWEEVDGEARLRLIGMP